MSTPEDSNNMDNHGDSIPEDGTVNMEPGSGRTATPGGLPAKIGQYVIKRIIASGGMGTVYEALQENPRRPAAVKVIKRSMASSEALRRFEREAQALARLRHAGIAQIYETGTYQDAGVSLPFFALEYIPNAKTLVEFARDKSSGVADKLDLFLQVCDAVHYGHQRGIIHRDLKPGNILVDSEGRVRIIDFGVARAVDADTRAADDQTKVGQIVGTAQYMSPEQFEADPNDLDTRSDVYALGVVLFELLSGKLPYNMEQSGVFEIARLVREEQPLSLSALTSDVSGEVELIVAKALEKNRESRYQSAFGFAEDIRRYLKGEAITARPTSLSYQVKVFARKNRAVVALASVAVFLLVAGVIATTKLYFDMKAERARAEVAAREAIAANEFLTNTLKSAVPPGWGDQRTIGDLCDLASEGVDEAFADNPTTEADVRNTIGRIYQRIDKRPQAEQELKKAHQLRAENLGKTHEMTVAALLDLQHYYYVFGPAEECVRRSREYVQIIEEVYGSESDTALEAKWMVVDALEFAESYVESEVIVRDIADRTRARYGEESDEAMYATKSHAWLLLMIGRKDAAKEAAQKVYESSLKLYEDNSYGRRTARNVYAAALVVEGDLSGAKKLYGNRNAPNPVGIELEYQGTLGDLSEDVKVMVFFETWCPYSQRYIPQVERLNKEYNLLNVDMIAMTRVNRSSSDAKVREFILDNQLTFNVLKETGRAWNYFDATGTPYTVVLHNGEVVWESPGAGGISSRLLEGLVSVN